MLTLVTYVTQGMCGPGGVVPSHPTHTGDRAAVPGPSVPCGRMLAVKGNEEESLEMMKEAPPGRRESLPPHPPVRPAGSVYQCPAPPPATVFPPPKFWPLGSAFFNVRVRGWVRVWVNVRVWLHGFVGMNPLRAPPPFHAHDRQGRLQGLQLRGEARCASLHTARRICIPHICGP